MARLTAGLALSRRAALFAAALVLALAAAPGAASAATINVGPTNDAAPGAVDDTGCTLRDAVQAANTNAPFSDCNGDNAGADTIVLQGGKTYTISQHAVDDTNAKGDLDITGPVTIRSSGPGLATINAGNTFSAGGPEAGADRVLDVRSTAGAVTLDGLRITNGFANPAGTDVGGGGILNAAQLTVLNSEIVGNQVQGTGITLGGGIYTQGSVGTLTVIGSTIANNRGLDLGNASSETLGGGIASYLSSPTMTITNSTISGNTVTGSNNGPGLVGGIFAGDSGNHPTANLTHVTITGNQALNPGGSFTGGLEIAAGTMTGDLVAGNSDPFGTFPDCDQVGTVTSGGGNLIGDPADPAQDCNFTGPGDLVGTHAAPLAANLGTLVDNGGLTRTQVPNPGSPAIDRGGSSCPDTDQRGFVRGPRAPCDAGAVEVGALPPAAAAGTAGTVNSKLTARADLNGKVKVKDLGDGHFLVITGISAACPDGGGTCTGSALVNSSGGSKRLASASKAAKKLGKAKLSVAAGRTQAVKVKLTKKASSALSDSGKLKVKISVELAAPGGTPATASRKAKLKRPH
jgi:CSLREA domain-containing protein